MIAWIENLLQTLAVNPFLQALIAALATFVMEDPTTITCGLLVSDNQMAYLTAFLGLSSGIILGDFGLYLLGRFAQPWVMRRRWINPEKIKKSRNWFNRNIVLAIMGSRFLPGTRLPTYLTAGILKVSAVKFLMIAVTATVIWTTLLLTLTIHFGKAVVTRLDEWKWPVAGAIVALIIIIQWFIRSRENKKLREHPDYPIKSVFEFWPPALFYIPVGVYYAWLSVRFHSPTLPTVSNPSIYSGGMIGESKSAILKLVPEKYLEYIARWTGFILPNSNTPLSAVRERANRNLAQSGLQFPLVGKPDVGQRGDGVRRLDNSSELDNYLSEFPQGHKMILQELIDYPQEAGIFYYRYPGQERGRVFSITLKEFPIVIGDGESTLRGLIEADPRARIIRQVYFRRHSHKLETVIPEGERFQLVFSGNHCKGAIFKNGIDLLTPDLEERIDAIAQSIPDFYFGRFDIRFKDEESLQRGEAFKIVEINGASSEATHIWDKNTKLSEAYATLFEQFRILFEIGDSNRRRGFKPLKLGQFIADIRRYNRQSQKYPNSD